MSWPTISKKDLHTLCEPFSVDRSLQSLKENNYAGVIFFDVGSVLVDLDWETYYASLETMASSMNNFSISKFREIAFKEKLNSIWSQGKMNTEEYVEKVNEILQLSCSRQNNIKISTYNIKQVDADIVGKTRNKVLDLAKKLRDKNFVLGILSNTTPWHMCLIHENLQVTKNFDVNIFSPDAGCEKPDPKIYEFAYRHAEEFIKKNFNNNLKKEDIYFIDDTPMNVYQAISHGWNARLLNLLNNDLLIQLKQNELTDTQLQKLSQNRENLLFGEAASERVEFLFRNLIS